MNLLYLCPSPCLGIRDRSGWSTHMASVIAGLRVHGHSVRPFLASGMRSASAPASASWLRSVTPAALRLARRDLLDLLHDRYLDRRVLAACRASQVEAIYERTEVYHAVGIRTARRLGLPLVLEVNGPLVDERLAWGGLLAPELARRIERAKYQAADRVVTVSAALRDHLTAEGVDPGKIEVDSERGRHPPLPSPAGSSGGYPSEVRAWENGLSLASWEPLPTGTTWARS